MGSSSSRPVAYHMRVIGDQFTIVNTHENIIVLSYPIPASGEASVNTSKVWGPIELQHTHVGIMGYSIPYSQLDTPYPIETPRVNVYEAVFVTVFITVLSCLFIGVAATTSSNNLNWYIFMRVHDPPPMLLWFIMARCSVFDCGDSGPSVRVSDSKEFRRFFVGDRICSDDRCYKYEGYIGFTYGNQTFNPSKIWDSVNVRGVDLYADNDLVEATKE